MKILNKLFQRSGNSIESTLTSPIIELGSRKFVMNGHDRTLNTMVIGSIGTGKLAGLAIPILNQDMHQMVSYIKTMVKEGKEKERNYLNGISVISPCEDLCEPTLQLARAHNIPEELITYINPLDPNTPSINAMRGPVDEVAEIITQVIGGLNNSKENKNTFFQESQRNHLKHYIYLLKLHDTEKEVTLDMLLEMYNDPQLVHHMHTQLKTTFPKSIDEIEDRDLRNHWKIVECVDQWFDENLRPKLTELGSTVIPTYNGQEEVLYFDTKAEDVQGLRSILNGIGENPLIRRVLFGNSDFDFERHLQIGGGILLVNTAKGELANLSGVLGKVVLMNLQNATFRRVPNESSFHHILIDEAPDYLYKSFRELTAQTRKYKVIITTFLQTLAQIGDQFGEHYMTTLIGTMRNRIIYGYVPQYDAKYFEEKFGLNFYFQEPMNYSASLVVNNRTLPMVQLQASFVQLEEFSKAITRLTVTEQNEWLKSIS